MNRFRSLTWSDQERRLRLLWRLVGFAVLLVILSLPAGLIAGLGLAIELLGAGDLTAARLDPFALVESWVNSGWYPAFTVGFLLAALGAAWLAARLLDRRPFASLGFHLGRSWWVDLAFGLLLGATLMTGIFLTERRAGWVTTVAVRRPVLSGQPFWPAILGLTVVFVSVGVYEETLVRGYLLRNLAEGLNGVVRGARRALLVAWLLSSALFGVLHALNPNASPFGTANLVLAGLFLGLGAVLTGELAIPIGLHITWNLFQGVVFGFPVSGVGSLPALVPVTQGGPDLWTGGVFGPEGGLIGLAAMILGSLCTLTWVHWRRRRVGFASQFAEYPAA